MLKRTLQFVAMAFAAMLIVSCESDETFVLEKIDFQKLTLADSTFWNGSDGSGEFVVGKGTFNNSFNTQFQSWSGFAYSNVDNMVLNDYANQYSAFIADGTDGSNIFGVAYVVADDAKITFSRPVDMRYAKFTNSTVAYLTMVNGNQFSKKFGGVTGTDPDFFMVTIKGYDANGTEVGTVDFYLADYTAEDNTKDYLVDSWTSCDLSSLKGVTELRFYLSSSDYGDWGMNTPSYFCIDDITYRYE